MKVKNKLNFLINANRNDINIELMYTETTVNVYSIQKMTSKDTHSVSTSCKKYKGLCWVKNKIRCTKR
ncbi:hypothetical protein CLA01_31120 [Chryseobacterium lathyri]|jgi:hypothetical protein|uniref:Uncharacterized protein n=1 Tax=Chryseobacterium lathyri TaxID=395933 RepID=A0A511YCW6_9FLAO|nr:hypothetical protein CLA01_31120 [Chryseobacterium lathyri]